MRRLLDKYRWELWLFIGVPTVASLIGVICDWSGLRWVGNSGLRDYGAVTGLAAAVAFGVTYPRVRRLGRPMLALLWRYSFAAAAVGGAGWIVISLLFSPERLDVFDFGRSAAALGGVMTLVSLWFAREASRTSLAHAFLFVALTFGTVSPITFLTGWISLREYVGFDLHVAMVVVGNAALAVALVTTMTLLSIWALTTFDNLDRTTRRRAIIALLALGAFGGYAFGAVSQISLYGYERAVSLLIYLAGAAFSILLILGLTYLVRVRQPNLPAATLPSAMGHAADVDFTDHQ